MVNVVTMQMGLNSKLRPIVRFAVFWQTPLGLMDDGSRELAIERLREADLEPALNMIPVSVAIDDQDSYEIIGR